MALRCFLLPALLVCGWVAPRSLAQIPATTGNVTSPAHKRALMEAYGRLPLAFVCNEGQTRKQVRFLACANNLDLFLTPTEAVISLTKPAVAPKGAGKNHPIKPLRVIASVVRLRLRDGNPHPTLCGIDTLPGKVNYFIGRDSKQWRHNLPTYARVRCASVYPGIDMIYYGNNRQLEYDFVVAPHANLKRIDLSFAGAKALHIEPSGELVLGLKDGLLRWRRPVVYQESQGHRKVVSGRYVALNRNSVGFAVGKYNASLPLVIDPQLIYSTYLGGTGSIYGGDGGKGIAVDAQGNAYITGGTASSDFPVTNGSVQIKLRGKQGNAFVTKLSATGSSLIYSTYLGGTGGVYEGDEGFAIAIDAVGNAYVTGRTWSSDFPVTGGAFQTMLKATNDNSNAFVTKLSATGSSLFYSTYLGGESSDAGFGIVVDARGNAYVTGKALSLDFPVTTGAFQTTRKGYGNAFVTKFNTMGNSLAYSTYLGGTNGDLGYGITVDAPGNAYVTGITYSVDFPVTKGAFQTTQKGYGNAFMTKLSTNGSSLVYSTYLGGAIQDFGYGIAVDAQGNAYVTGKAGSSDFPVTRGAYQTILKSKTGNAFVTKLNASGSKQVYSTFLGGSGSDSGNGIAIDSQGNAYIVGWTNSSDFPVTKAAFQTTLKSASYNTFVTKLGPIGNSLVYSTYLGGEGNTDAGTWGAGIAVDARSKIFVTGVTGSSSFPVTGGAFQTTLKSTVFNAFITKLQPPISTYFSVVPNVTGALGGKVLLMAQLNDGSTKLGIAKEKVIFTFNAVNLGTISTDTHGNASFAYLIPDGLSTGKTYPIQVSFNGDSTYAPVTGTGMLSLIQGKTAFTSAPNATGKPGAKVTFTVKLTRSSDGKGVGKETVMFTVDGVSIGTAQTDNTGTVAVSYTIPLNAKVGAHPTTATFSGDTNYSRCTGTGTLTVTK